MYLAPLPPALPSHSPPSPDPGYIPPRCLSCHNMLQKPIPTIDASRLPGFPLSGQAFRGLDSLGSDQWEREALDQG